MKIKNLIKVILLVFIGVSVRCQSLSCVDLKNAIETEAEFVDSEIPINSKAISKVEYYRYKGNGFVIVYLKSNEFDYGGNPYIFCGISDSRWSNFIRLGRLESWGKSFHTYIKESLCNCF